MRFKDYKKKALQDPSFAKEYAKYDLSFEIAKMLIEARILKNKTQAELAKSLGITQPNIARAESGRTLPSISFLKRLADVYNTELIVKFAFMERSADEVDYLDISGTYQMHNLSRRSFIQKQTALGSAA